MKISCCDKFMTFTFQIQVPPLKCKYTSNPMEKFTSQLALSPSQLILSPPKLALSPYQPAPRPSQLALKPSLSPF